MLAWLAAIIEAILKAFLTPKAASATSEAERAGAAEAAVKADDAQVAQLDRALAARDLSDRVSAERSAVVPDPGGPGGADGLPDDGFRRD